MGRTVGIGYQDFEQLRLSGCFYVDKTGLIKEWWESGDVVTLITRPRRFGKTLNMSMIEQFFSVTYKGKEKLFQGLRIWEEEEYRSLQGSYPVIFLSFSDVKEKSFEDAVKKINYIIEKEFNRREFLLESGCLNEKEKNFFHQISAHMEMYAATSALSALSEYLYRYYQKKVIILLDEYDTPMQEAYVNGYWTEMADFIGSLFHATFKANQYLFRAFMTGITRISRESIFSDLNNLNVVTTTSDLYAKCFGFTEEEVGAALKEYGIGNEMQAVKEWYDGFTFGNCRDIYNPWSIINFLKERKFSPYWANTSSNRLIGRLIREGSREVKVIMEDLLNGKTFHARIDEQIVFEQLDYDENAVWSLLLAGGYLRVEKYSLDETWGSAEYELALTNKEIRIMFAKLINGWFMRFIPTYNDFIKALLIGDIKAMNAYMNDVALATFSYFDTGKKPSKKSEPERFYHGFVLGLLVDLAGKFTVTSNRESGFGRYDVILEPCDKGKKEDAVILEFKVYDPEKEETLLDTVNAALNQIEEKDYAAVLEARGIAPERIRKYGFAFEGKTVLIGAGMD